MTREPDDDADEPLSLGSAGAFVDELVAMLVEQTLAQTAPDRQSFLEGACAGDAALFQEVWRRVASDVVPAPQPPDHGFSPGDVLNGRFRIVRPVARGGMGIIYDAWDETLDKRVALKCALLGFGRRLPPEVRHATEITHPNVCRVFEIHTTRREGMELDFLTMEFLEGQTLAQRLREGPLPRAEARAIATQICDGLAEAHRRGVIHGDLKANNIILTSASDGAGRAVITDFGLARGVPTAGAASAETCGTPEYMAPELWTGAQRSIASDIYALGVLLFELAHGHRPPRAGVASEAPVPASRPARRWDRVIARCMAGDPDRRYASVTDVLAAMRPLSRRPVVRAAAAAMVVIGALWAGGFIAATYRDRGAQSVAVIPFDTEGVPEGSEYLSEGIADSLIHTLAQFPNLNVIARTSSFQFAGGKTSLDEVAQRLGASLVVTGRVRRVGDRLVIGAELVNPAEGTQLWGQQYDVDSTTLRGAQEDIARRIAEQVGIKLNLAGVGAMPRTAVRSEAYELLLRGQYQRRLYTPESRQKAVGYFEQALAVDPLFALAHAELANIYRLLAGGGILDPADAMPRAEAAAQRALAADANLAEAHAALADILKDRWNWAAAEQEYQTAVALKPSLADAHMGYAILLSVTGRYPAALEHVRKVRELDPVGLPGALHAAAVHYNARRYADALTELARARALDPSAPSPWMWMGMVFGGSGRYAEAVHAYRESMARGDNTPATLCFYVFALARSGDRAEAQRVFDQVLQSREFVPLTALAVAYAGLDQPDKTIELLQQAYARPDPILQYLKVESHFDGLNHRPEYSALAAKMRLP